MGWYSRLLKDHDIVLNDKASHIEVEVTARRPDGAIYAKVLSSVTTSGDPGSLLRALMPMWLQHGLTVECRPTGQPQ